MTTIRRFTKNINNRKDLVKKISSITGIASRYTGMPSMAYQIGNFTIEKDGTLVVTMYDDGRQQRERAVILALKADGMIGEEIIQTPEEIQARQAEQAEIAESVNVADETASELPNLPAMETTETSEATAESSITNDTADAAEAAETCEQPQAAMLETSGECQQIAEAPEASPELTASTASTGFVNSFV